jgi:UDP-N-acetylmuramoylalanine--D-glutamate ligase
VATAVRELRGRRALVLGLGKSGLAATELLMRERAIVTAADDGTSPALEGAASELRAVGARICLGALRPDELAAADVVVKSPGILPTHPVLAAARARGVPIIGEVELCVPWLQRPIVAITGTNGKSTTTALTGHLLTTGGWKVFTGGNLGTPVARQVMDGGQLDATVIELSSYQIDDLSTFRCDVAAVLNVTPDHLERYGTMEAYAAAKERLLSLVAPGGVAVLNAEDQRTRAMAARAPSRVALFGHGESVPDQLRESGGVIVRRTAKGEERYTVGARSLRGSHNLENAMAAIEAARSLDLPQEAVQRGLDTYPGLPHRIELIRTVGGVDWINDSKATNVDSVEKSLAAFPGPLHLIMGGKGKGAPYAPLRALFPGRVIRLYVIGQDADRIVSELGDLASVERAGDLATAVGLIRRNARAGETALLSPACASFDQFRSFEHRGEVFRQLVQSLPEGPR